MPPTRIVDVLAEVFRTHGFDTTAPAHPEDKNGRTRRVELHAEKNGLDVIVAVAQGSAEQDRAILEEHAALRDALGAHYALVAATHEVADPLRQNADQQRVIVWDADQLARAIGRAVLFEVTGAEDLPVADLLSPSPMPSLPPLTPSVGLRGAHENGPLPAQGEAPENGHGEPFPFGDLVHAQSPGEHELETVASPPAAAPTRNVESGRGWYMETSSPPPATPTAPAQPAMPAPPATLKAPGARNGIPTHRGRDPHTFTPTDGALLAPSVDKEAAAATARAEVFTVENTRLRYHPKRLYRWRVEAFVEGQVKTHTLSGTCLVDLATKKLEVPPSWDAPRHLREGTFDVPVDHKPVRMDSAQAHELVIAHVLDETAREATMQDDDNAGDYALTVKRRVRVQKEDVRVEDEGLHWCPVWWISGKNGEMDVDGLTGMIREKRLENVPSETILL